MGIIRMIVVGFIVGVLARFFYPGAVNMGFIMTVLLGIAGSFLAGLIGMALSPAQRAQGLHPAGFLYSILGGMLVIFIVIRFHLLGA
ncbi:GlsB/YeaQ/YmgE family stress response membrane protein [Sphingomonas panacisoli]|uniref:GlsB/YeaQ/YmgE family stress response membrane protein n=1 Tax=Sphingomonas panacisoli TaxID=1813879 RepID=A0A5B8LLW3_9SPHN|nr:GlsB/YeaQ/YmgE family stress response membrane protein [Sphingomonas panacisoli]QDZ08472.1 GlsB/YeaQ/YmgE family stress response membrane protein [Sphingomonas panacisoli]